MALSDNISKWIKKQVEEANKKGIVVGLSGGVDSACVLALGKKALGENVLGLILPCESQAEDVELARETAAKFHTKTKEIYLDDLFKKVVSICQEPSNLAKANLKPRLRMTVLYYFANNLNYLVAGTGNKSELAIGYFTKYGDGGVDILPLGGILKTDIRKLARELGVPEKVIKRPPSAGLWEGQTDEGEMGVTYDELDRIIGALEKKETAKIDKKLLARVKKMMENSEHKRCDVPIFSAHSKH